MSKRTNKQTDANQLDMEIFRVVGRMQAFANDHKELKVGDLASAINSMRGYVRDHMHKEDRDGTQ